jgi:hypothetical protein
MSDKKTVTVKALEPHTAMGKSYDVGDTYEADAALVDSLVTQGKAVPADHDVPPPHVAMGKATKGNK